jgi:hypothetical protein
MIDRPRYIATAFYSDPYAGQLAAYLVPFKTTRRRDRVVSYRWQTDRGGQCGVLATQNVAALVAYACRSPHFTDVAVLIEARDRFEVTQ